MSQHLIDADLHELRAALDDVLQYGLDEDKERALVRMYNAAHDSLLEYAPSRTPEHEQWLALYHARLSQLGVDESRMPWELSVSFNLRLAEGMEQWRRTLFP